MTITPRLLPDAELAAIAARLEGATEGPWLESDGQPLDIMAPNGERLPWRVATVDVGVHSAGPACDDEAQANCDFIAAARTDISRLLAHCHALAGLLRDLGEDSSAARLALRYRAAMERVAAADHDGEGGAVALAREALEEPSP